MKVIALVGGVGVGKTYYGRRIASMLSNCQFIEEDTRENMYLNEFYQDMRKWGFHSRISMISMVLSNYYKISEDAQYVIIDRCVNELIVFAKKEHDEGNLTDKEFSLYSQLYEAICKSVPEPDLYVYFRCSGDTSYQRVVQRARECEKNVSKDFCIDVIQRYEKWYADNIFEKKRNVYVDTDCQVDIDKLFDQIVKTL